MRGVHAYLLHAGLSLAWNAAAQPFLPGQVYLAQNGHIEYRCGDLPLVIAVPHGGALMPADIPDRTCNNPVYDLDARTIELVDAIDSVFAANDGCRPHVVINHLSRRKLDANRDLADGACGDPQAVAAWQAFHAFIDSAKARAANVAGKGLFLDLHGHGHSVQRLELGYLLYEDELALPDATLNTATYINYSSIRALALANAQGLSHAELLRGPQALGTRLGDMGFPAVPSQQDPFPLAGQAYFSGGYNTARHGSLNGGAIDGVQLECNFTGVRDTPSNRGRFADSLRVALVRFIDDHLPAPQPACITGLPAPAAPLRPRIHPNPCTRELHIALPTGLPAAVLVTDLAGRPVLKEHTTKVLAVEGLNPGIYTLHLLDSMVRTTFVKQ